MAAVARAELTLSTVNFSRGIAKAQNLLSGLEKRALGFSKINILGGLIVGAGLTSAIRGLATFEASLKRAEVLTGDLTGASAALRDEAGRLGASTQFSASEAADGFVLLAQAGLDAQEIIASSADFLNLAAAGGGELAEAFDIGVSAIRQFNIEASNSDTAVDTLVNTANSSKTTITSLGEAFVKLGPISNSLGRTIQEAAAAVGILGDAGVEGSIAGRGLSQIFLRLASPTAEAEAEIAKLGLSLQEINPAANNIETVFANLERGFGNAANASDKVSAASEIFGKQFVAQGLILADNVEKLRELTAANNEAGGIAKTTAQAFQDQLGGAFKQLKSRIESVILSLGDAGITSALRNTVDRVSSILTELAENDSLNQLGKNVNEGVNSIIDNLPDVGVIVDNITNAFKNFGDAVGPALVALRDIAGVLISVGGFALEHGKAIGIAAGAYVTLSAAVKAANIFNSLIKGIGTVTTLLGLSTAATTAETRALGANTGAQIANRAARGGGLATSGAAAGSRYAAAFGSAAVGGISSAIAAVLGGIAAGIGAGVLVNKLFEFSGLDVEINEVITKVTGIKGKLEEAGKASAAIDLRRQLLQAADVETQERINNQLIQAKSDLYGQVSRAKALNTAEGDEQAKGLNRELQLISHIITNFDDLAGRSADLTRSTDARVDAQHRLTNAVKDGAAAAGDEADAIAKAEKSVVNLSISAKAAATAAVSLADAGLKAADAFAKPAQTTKDLTIAIDAAVNSLGNEANGAQALNDIFKDINGTLTTSEILISAATASQSTLNAAADAFRFALGDAFDEAKTKSQAFFNEVQKIEGFDPLVPIREQDANIAVEAFKLLNETGRNVDKSFTASFDTVADLVDKFSEALNTANAINAINPVGVSQKQAEVDLAKQIQSISGATNAESLATAQAVLAATRDTATAVGQAPDTTGNEQAKANIRQLELDIQKALLENDQARADTLKSLLKIQQDLVSAAKSVEQPDRGAALDQALQQLDAEQKIIDKQKEQSQNTQLRDFALDIAEAEAKLTETLSDDRGVRQQREILALEQQIQALKAAGNDASASQVQRLLDLKRQEISQVSEKAKAEAQLQNDILRAEADKDTSRAKELKDRQRLGELIRGFEGQGIDEDSSVALAKERLDLEQRRLDTNAGNLDLEKQRNEIAKRRDAGSRQVATRRLQRAQDRQDLRQSRIDTEQDPVQKQVLQERQAFEKARIEGTGQGFDDLLKKQQAADARIAAEKEKQQREEKGRFSGLDALSQLETPTIEAAKTALQGVEKEVDKQTNRGLSKKLADDSDKPSSVTGLLNKIVTNTKDTVTELTKVNTALGALGLA